MLESQLTAAPPGGVLDAVVFLKDTQARYRLVNRSVVERCMTRRKGRAWKPRVDCCLARWP